MKISVSSYSFASWMQKENKTQLDTIAKAKELGFEAIEFSDINPPEGISVAEYGKMLKTECDRVGIEISCISYIADLIKENEEDAKAEIERIKSLVDIAADMNVERIRHDAAWNAGRYETFENALPHMADACREITKYAASKGVKTMVENHGRFVQDSERMENLFSSVNHPNFSLLVDMGNFMCADELSIDAVHLVAPMAGYVHAKDFYLNPAESGNVEGAFPTRGGNFLKGAILGNGIVPVLSCLETLKAAGYDGYVALEYEGCEEAISAIKTGKANLERYIALL